MIDTERQFRRIVACWVLLAVQACATVPMNAKLPVEVQDNLLFGAEYLQSGVDIERSTLQAALEAYPPSEPLARRSWWLGVAGTVLSLSSSTLLLVGVFTGDKIIDADTLRPTPWFTTAMVLTLGGLALGVISESEFEDAVQSYNARFSTAPR